MPDGPRTEPWSRTDAIERLAAETFDVVVVGGGVTGAGVARDAALRGLRVALVEASDWAQGTSSRTTKFAHGGLRYLETLDFALVREALAERAVLLSIARHLTRPTPFLLPVYAGRGRPSWKLRAGLQLYDALAGRTRLGRHQMLDRRGALAHEPDLRREGLKGAGVYWDARVRDARLVVETVADARRAGAVAASRCAVGEIERWKMGWAAEVEDRVNGGRLELRGRVWVNATGPWSDRLRARVAPDARPLLAPTRGVHVVVPRAALPLHDPTALFAPDGRLVFAVPQGEWAYVGTTDTADHGDVDDLSVRPDEVAYLVGTADAALERPLYVSDVAGAWAGWRPLVRPERELRWADVSREEAIEETAPGFWTVAGGKLTTYRAMAEAVLDRAIAAVGWSTGPCVTARRPLVPAELGGTGPPRGAPPSAVARVRGLFGPDADDVFARWREEPSTAEPLADDLAYTTAEVERAAREMALSLEDLLDRRLLTLPGGVPLSEDALRAAAAAAAPALGWDAERIEREVAGFRAPLATSA